MPNINTYTVEINIKKMNYFTEQFLKWLKIIRYVLPAVFQFATVREKCDFLGCGYYFQKKHPVFYICWSCYIFKI